MVAFRDSVFDAYERWLMDEEPLPRDNERLELANAEIAAIKSNPVLREAIIELHELGFRRLVQIAQEDPDGDLASILFDTLGEIDAEDPQLARAIRQSLARDE
jgi:hypothetical protein